MTFRLFDPYVLHFQTPDDGHSYFFGYYDKSPLDRENQRLLAHRVPFDGRDVGSGDVADIGYFDLVSGEFRVIDRTLAWNWQQGSQLQWLPSSNDTKVIYNSIQDSKFVSIIYDLDTNEKQVVPFSVYSVHPNGKEALAVNYERLFWCRPGYNYQNVVNEKWDIPVHQEDGIYRVNLSSGEVNLIVGIKEIVSIKSRPEFQNCDSWLEHVMYNPSGNRFLFFHRYRNQDVDVSRVFTANSENGDELYMYPDVGFYSHYAWKKNEVLTIWCRYPGVDSQSTLLKIKNSLKSVKLFKKMMTLVAGKAGKILPETVQKQVMGKSYLVNFNDKTNDYETVCEGVIDGNGHQSWFDDGNKLIYDTYQDNDGFRNLYVCDVAKGKQDLVGQFYSEYNDCTYRCDLHPRLSVDNNFAVIDSAHSRQRKIMVIRLR